MNYHNIRKSNIIEQADKVAKERDKWIKKNSYFYKNDNAYMKFIISEGARVLELGCGTGQLLNALNPSYGVGVDLSANMISVAQKRLLRNHLNIQLHRKTIQILTLFKEI